MEIGLVTDSTCDLDYGVMKENEIEMVPLNIHFGEEVYKDIEEIKQDNFFKKMTEVEKLPTTSQPSVGAFKTKYDEMARRYDAVISIHLSSKLSGTCKSAIMAARQVDKTEIIVIDSLSASLGLGYLVLLAKKLIKEDKSPEEIELTLLEARKNISIYFIVNDLTYLEKGGRIGKAQAFLGSILNFYPILGLPGESGEVIPVEKTRGKKKITRKLVKLTEAELEDEKKSSLGLIHATERKHFTSFRNQLAQVLDRLNIEVKISENWISSVLGCHVGPTVYGIVIFKGEILEL